LDLYDRKIEELQRDAGARTYALSLHYDVAREQQLAQEAQRERQWQQKISVVLVLLLVVLILLLIVLWRYWVHRRREQAMQLEALRNKYIQQLQLALERLQQKVNLTREIELQHMRGNEVEFPKWLQTYRDEQLTMNKESIDELIQSVDEALDGAISRLRKELAEADELKLRQEQFVAAIRRFLEVQVLTRPLLQELIDHIDVFETEGVGKSRSIECHLRNAAAERVGRLVGKGPVAVGSEFSPAGLHLLYASHQVIYRARQSGSGWGHC
jgi:hypothetical protein